MKEIMIDSKRIRLGKLTYFDVEHNGSAVPKVDAYAFLINVNGSYVNPFNIAEELPVYDRVPYSNTTASGVDYGTKIKLVNGEAKDGPCYVLEKTDVGEYYGTTKISLNMLKEYIIQSNRFFVDRVSIVEEKSNKNGILSTIIGKGRNYNRRKFIDDQKLLAEFNEFIDECAKESGFQYRK